MAPNQPADACTPLDLFARQQAVRVYSSVALVCVVLVLVAFVGFYALLYRRTDAARRPSTSLKREIENLCNGRFDGDGGVDDGDDDGDEFGDEFDDGIDNADAFDRRTPPSYFSETYGDPSKDWPDYRR